MRYHQRTPFLNQIKSAKSAGAMSRVYWVAAAHDYERGRIVEELLYLIAPGKANLQKWTEWDPSALSNHLQTADLFGEEPIALVENGESIPKADAPLLERLFPRDFGVLICSASSKSALSERVEAVGVVLDLLAEKPWEREKRIQQTLEQLVHKAGKTMAPNALSALLERHDVEEGILEREIEKLICYTGDRAQISIEDVETVSTPNRTYAVWQSAERVVWERSGFLDEAHFHALVPALRSQLQLGLKIATMLAENAPPEVWSSSFPKVFPKTVEKRTRDAARLGARYFARGLETLFEIELLSRSGSQSVGALLDFFHCALYS